MFEMPLPTETLEQEEVVRITGYGRKGDQVQWLSGKGRIFFTNKAGEPIIGCLYARLKLAGINPSHCGGRAPDFSKVPQLCGCVQNPPQKTSRRVCSGGPSSSRMARCGGFYYNGRDEHGKSKKIPLGTDPNEAKRKWAELKCKPAPADTGLMRHVFDRYVRDVIPIKAPRAQKDNEKELKQLRAGFDNAPVDAITPQYIAQYRDKRSAKTRANRELALLSHVFNMTREWGCTAKENPCRGVRKNKETPRDFYADDDV